MKNTIASNLKIKDRSGADPVTTKYKMLNVIAEQLKKNIKDVIVPTLDNVHSKDINTLMRDVIFE